MKHVKTLQVIVIALSLAVFLGVLLLPKNYSVAQNQQMAQTAQEEDVQAQIAEIKAQLSPEKLAIIEGFEAALKSAGNMEEKAAVLDSITFFWDKSMTPAVAAIYAEQKAGVTQNKKDWTIAGNRYLSITTFLSEADRPWAYSQAQRSFEAVLAQDSTDVEARISLGVCMVNAGQNPMAGIKMITSVLEEDSTNLRAIVELGQFSITSRQFPKAIARFEQALRVKPDFYEAYLFLGETYGAMGELDNALLYLKKYRDTQTDKEVLWQVDNRMKELEEMKGSN